MNRHESMLRIAANSDISVLLLGESGSGKEVAARFIHEHSQRAGGPFVALNCGAIARGLAESILEGHRKGAFTGAGEERAGLVRSAEGGTLFLDEIGEMPLETQCKLLRILQERTVMPLGCYESVPVNFRLVCATNRDLRSEIAAGRFREDLFFRLNVFPVKIPPLREREDFERIVYELWRDVNGASARMLNPYEMALLRKKPWPGNVRQLKNVLQRFSLLQSYGVTLSKVMDEEFGEAPLPPKEAGIVAPHRTGAPEHLMMGGFRNFEFAYERVCDRCGERGGERVAERARRYSASPEWNLICTELAKNEGNRSVTAQKLGISRGCLNYQIKKHSS